ncbi:MAG: histidinol dehydrogenase [Chitinispirillales bacterium]|jgi:histidinol dehydrogenase|nr:histidinol dehydrogenase [Chitinispirillales bacterium]
MRSKSRTHSIPIVEVNSAEGKKILKLIKNGREKRSDEVTRIVSSVLENVRARGDKALFEYTEKFDKVRLTSSTARIPESLLKARAKLAPPALKKAIQETAKRIEAYHKKQGLKSFSIKTSDGILKQLVKPLRRVGVYIPGGHTVYSSSVLMDIIPARIAGVKEIVAVTPPRDELDTGVAYALNYLKVEEIYRVGGAQAVGALAYGTQTIAPVDKIVGPGNSYVATAKRLVYGNVDIDSVAGPSEVVIIADASAPPRLVALDLLAQAEHGSGDEIAVCIVESKSVASKIAAAVSKEIEISPVKETLLKLPPHAITILVTASRKESMELSDSIAPEHLQIMTKTADEDLLFVNNAAAVFVGIDTPVALGDYYIGTNHVLPTGGAARFASPLGVESFQKRISVAKASPKGILTAAGYVSVFARSEAFEHHALSVEVRAKNRSK